ncbi:di-trans,poly-cis-decaprenylcistransferase [Candidatus Roizmanbacteria bacterium RIFCSPHIGHO2_12_FULL_33_9]|uniref:Isoprenyl transferase n=1 Tax=Candidatus Roizmanbacteria bacterium RIFCSPHIGHO2_12_FULL_33_9 TaxID=1802045 RepID=A0A1F7HFS3_9BACT|nr:MAG: di-trans,poly-cis-decaprenylcistransferase [Candidatus Roizmanbacteria bacterium RIFCSPHIGHO2_12_FULL_33_9]
MASNIIPNHVAIIPDGNRRWAKGKSLPTFEGHRRGFEIMRNIGRRARELGIKILTVWAFSTENWNRSKEEIEYLMDIYESWVDLHLEDAMKDKVRIIHMGRKDRIRDSLRKKLESAELKTKNFSKFYLCIALDYGGKDEIIRAVKSIKNKMDAKELEKHLDTKDLPYPNPDLVIRTSGEFRTSGFMPWQTVYSEYIILDKHFPDFTTKDLEECLTIYGKRKRRFGI